MDLSHWDLSQEDLPGIVNRKDGFTFGTAETAGLKRLEFFGTNWTGKNFGEQRNGFSCYPFPKKIDGIVQIILNIKELGKSKKLKNFVYFRLNFKKNQISAPGLYRFEESRKRTNSGRGNVVKPSAMKHQPDKPRLNGFLNPLLEIIRIVGIYIPGEIEDKTTFYFINFLKFDFEAFILFIIKSINYVVVCHDVSFDHYLQHYTRTLFQ